MSTQPQVIQSQQHDQDIVHKIRLAIKDLRFGSVEVVQIERKEKIRFDTHQSQPTQ